MSGQTNERAFEGHVEEVLLGQGAWQSGTNAEWDAERALFPVRVCSFLEATQPKLWKEMRGLHAAGLESLLTNTLVKELDLKGTLHVLRHGFKFYGKTFRIAYFKPAHGLNDEILALYAKNQLTVTRQVLCHPGRHDTVDLLFAVNGLPVATCELKNPGTGQSWRNAVRQYKKDRDPRVPLFGFKTRALVHFAADPDEVHMATRLRGEDTLFLPFNRGSHPCSQDTHDFFQRFRGLTAALQMCAMSTPGAVPLRQMMGVSMFPRSSWTTVTIRGCLANSLISLPEKHGCPIRLSRGIILPSGRRDRANWRKDQVWSVIPPSPTASLSTPSTRWAKSRAPCHAY